MLAETRRLRRLTHRRPWRSRRFLRERESIQLSYRGDSNKSRVTVGARIASADRVCTTSRKTLLRRMRRRKFAAARFLRRLEFHQFNPRHVGIEHVQLVLPVAAHLRMLLAMSFPAMRLKQCLGFLHIYDTERNVIHHT